MRFWVFSLFFIPALAHADKIEVAPPKGFVQFCKDYNCKKRGTESFEGVHIDVNKKIKPQADLKEHWDFMPYYGDCDDYAISKWYRSQDFDLAIICHGEQLHLVAVKDGMIYDSLTNKPRPIKGEVVIRYSQGLKWFI